MDTITYEIKGVERLIRRLQAAQRDKVLIDALDSGTLHLRHWITTNRLSGRPGLIHRSGTLARSITPVKAKRIGDVIEARIGTNVVYAKIHEFGSAGLPGGVIRPKTKPFLAWKDADTGKWRFAKEVRIPARPFMGPSLKDKGNRQFILDEIVTGIKKAIERQQ